MKIESMPPSVITSRAPRGRSKPIAVTVTVLALALAGAGGYAYLHRTSAPAKPDTAAAPKAKAKDPIYELSRRDIARIDTQALSVTLPLTGSLAPLSQATVKSKVSGVVLASNVQEGMQVTAGQVIAKLDDAEARARVAQQQAMLNDAEARLAMARKNQTNSATLLQQKFIAQNAYDTTSNAVDLAQAGVDSAKAQLDLMRIALADTVIRAPLSGVVSKRLAQAGDKLAPDTPVLSIVDLKHLTLDAQVPASDIPRIKVGQPVAFHVDGFGNRAFTGKVARINPAAEAGSRALVVYVDVDNPDGALRAGMYATGAITTATSSAHPLLPAGAVRRENGRDVVYRVDGGKVVAQPVTLGLRNADEGMVEALDGAADGMIVLAVPLEGVKPGSQVKLPDTAAAANNVPPKG